MKKNVIKNFHRPIIIGIVAGESSGDILGAGLIRALKKRLKSVFFYGIGGPYMKLEKMESWYDIEELSVIGIFEIFKKLPYILKIRRNLIYRFLNLKPDVFIGIDFPDFNLTLEKCLKKSGIRTIHYVSPSVWAWRKKRIFKLKKFTNNVLLIFPFEKEIYDRFNIPCRFIGHTLADIIPLHPNKKFIRHKLGIHQNDLCLSLLPGSRIRELKMLLHDFLTCSELLMQYFPNLIILVPLVTKDSIQYFFTAAKSRSVRLKIFNYCYNSWEIMAASDVSLLASGTATLECMLAKCPMVVAYRVHPITFFLLKKILKIPWISLPNILSRCFLVKEFVQNDCHPENLLKELLYLLNNRKIKNRNLKDKFLKLHYDIRCNADEQAASAVLELIK